MFKKWRDSIKHVATLPKIQSARELSAKYFIHMSMLLHKGNYGCHCGLIARGVQEEYITS